MRNTMKTIIRISFTTLLLLCSITSEVFASNVEVFDMPRPFRVNLPSSDGSKFIEFSVAVDVTTGFSESLKSHIPLIEGTILAEVSNMNFNDIGSIISLKEHLSREVRKSVIDVSRDGYYLNSIVIKGFVYQTSRN